MAGCVGGKRLLTAEGIKEKVLPVRRRTSGEPIFTNGAQTGAFSYLFASAASATRTSGADRSLSFAAKEAKDGSTFVIVDGDLSLGDSTIRFRDSIFVAFQRGRLTSFELGAVLIGGSIDVVRGPLSIQLSELALGVRVEGFSPSAFTAQGAFTRSALGVQFPGSKSFNFTLTDSNINIPNVRNRIERRAREFP